MYNPPSHTRCSPSHGRGQMQISRCVDCSRPLFTKSWKEKIKGQLKAKFLWPSKKRQDLQAGRYIVKQRCAECQEPLRCAECSEAFFGNLSADEIRVFIKAMVLFAMKGLCVDCSHDFKFVYEELFDESNSYATPRTEIKQGEKQHSPIVIDGAIANPKVLSEIEPLEEIPKGKKRQDDEGDVMEWKGGVFLGDWKREINDLLCNRFHLVLER